MTTEKYDIMVLAYDASRQRARTLSRANLREQVGRPAEYGQRVCVDPRGRYVAAILYQGMLSIMPLRRRSGSWSLSGLKGQEDAAAAAAAAGHSATFGIDAGKVLGVANNLR